MNFTYWICENRNNYCNRSCIILRKVFIYSICFCCKSYKTVKILLRQTSRQSKIYLPLTVFCVEFGQTKKVYNGKQSITRKTLITNTFKSMWRISNLVRKWRCENDRYVCNILWSLLSFISWLRRSINQSDDI